MTKTMTLAEVNNILVAVLLSVILNGAGVGAQTVVVLQGGTATFTDVTIPGTGGTVVLSAGGQQIMQLDIFGSTVFPAYQNRVSVTNFNNGFRDGRASFVITRAEKGDAGNFQCQSQFEGTQPCGTATLIVADAPTKPTLNVLADPVIVGSDVIVECLSTSTSVPASSALKLAYNLKENGRLALQQPTGASRFKISNISKAKTGAKYTCVAYELNTLSNALTGLKSPDSNEYIMNPLYPPDALLFAPAETNYALSSSDVVPDVTCSADCKPACSLDWYKDSQIYQAGATLSLGPADKADAGNYFCRAKNSVGSKDKPLIITVQDNVGTPELIPPNLTYDVPEGTALEDIFCRAQCTPECTYRWERDGQRLLENSQGIRLGTVGPSASGTYTCLASNGEDDSQVSFVVNVQYPPKELPGRDLISPSTSVYKVEEGALVLPDISCNGDCNPPCDVKWTKENSGPVPAGNVLSLGAASRDDTGTYICTASNSLGKITTKVDVMIEFRPEQVSLTPPTARYNSVENVDVIPDVRCSAVCQPACAYEWYAGSGGTPLSRTQVLSLGAADRAAEGRFTCRASNKVGQATASFDVSVLYGPAAATISPPQDSYTVPTGRLLPPVTCSADCKPACSYKWVKDDSVIPITTLRTLTLGNAASETAGIYKCIASNDHGSADTKLDLVVQSAASTVELQPPQNSHDLAEGDDLTVTCDATCDPACDFKWKDGLGNVVANTRRLQLRDVASGDAGQYTCVADNNVGIPARRSISVNVFVGPAGKITITPPGPVLALKQGNSVVLTCAVECSPVCDIQWLKGSRALPSQNGILTLNDVDRDQNGAYTCQASNRAGSGERDVVLNIQYGPGDSVTFNPNRTSHPVEENSDLSITCSADCKPECTYVWRRGATDVAFSDVLLIENAQRNEAGGYSCTADNSVRQPATGRISVDVLYGPMEVRMFPDEAQLYPVKGSSVSLKCWATCNPECSYTWYKGSSVVPDALDGELDLRNVTTDSSGIYLCSANNRVGDPETRSVEINVRAGPGTSIRFSPPDENAIVREGRQFKVDCIAECSPACDYEWRKGSQVVSRQSTLEIPVADRATAGSYICFASNDDNSQASKPLSLEVTYGPGESISVFPPGRVQSVTEGAPFNIKCSAECDPACDFKWFLGPNLLPYDNGVLFSDAARQDQAGTYTCQASNGIDTASSLTVTIDVQTGPGRTLTFTPPGSKQVVREGGDLLVTCSADCSPPCDYTWTFGAQELSTVGGRLELSSLGRDQRGAYSCLADNGLGSQITKPLNVDVLYGPAPGAIDIFPETPTQVLNEGASLSLKCSADCSPACSYTWYLGNDVVDSSAGVLSLVAVGPENAGTYRCSAENSIGLTSSNDVTIAVQTGPGNTVKIEPEGELYNVTEGRPLRMRCSALCSPACTYTWYFGFERVKSDDGLLSMDTVNRNMSGPFVCYAANDVGLQGSRLIQVDVQYGPVDGVALDPDRNVTVVSTGPLSLRCSASCNPPCEYTWYQGPQPRVSEGGKLTVARANEADGGSYTCRARNDVGSQVSDVVNVAVQYGPRDTIQLQPAGPTYVIQEGDDVTATCTADCKPDCIYTWYAGPTLIPSVLGKMTIENFRRDMARFYACFADNGLGSRAMTPLEIRVTYGPGAKPALFPDTSPLSATIGGAVSVQCTAECTPACNYTWTLNGQVVTTDQPGSGILQLRSLQPSQAGRYVCSAGNGIGSGPAVASVDIVLQSGPGASIRFIPPGLTATVQEGGTLGITCDGDCAPACSFVWTKNGEQVSSRPQLLLTNAQRVQEGVYQCNAQNALGVNVTQQLTVTVEHGPQGSVKLFPPEGSTQLNRGDTLSVQCSARCQPPCNFAWRKGTNVLSTEEGVLLVPNVTPSDRGAYTCTADNGKGSPQSVVLNVNVNFGPEDTVTFNPPEDERSVLEGQTLTVDCSAQCLPACTYTWYLSSRKLDAAGGVLTLPSVTRQDAGTYTCHADNGVGRRVSRELALDVEYPPNQPTFDPATTAYTLRERIDSVSDIRCFADCNPRCTIKWLKDGDIFRGSNSNVLAFPTPDRNADGTYTCVASNIHGSRQKDLTINVNFAPSITFFTINDRKTEAKVPEKYPVTLNCRVSSQPPATIRIYNGTDVIQEIENTVQAKFAWKQTECLDAGRYRCVADNGVGALVSVSAELQVLCPPRLDPRVFQQLLVAAEQGQTAVIRVPSLANPPPSFLWYKVRDGVPSVILEGTNSTQGLSDKFFTVNGTTSTLTIENVQLADFGDYVVSMANSRGSDNITFSLVPQSVPYQARNLTVRPIDPNTVGVSWSPGFNGGDKQQFLLEYLKAGTNGWRALELDPRINDVTRSINMNVSDLNPATSYTFRLRSRNVFGLSNYTQPAKVLTPSSKDAVVSNGEVNPTPILLGVGLALGFLVGAGITAIVVVSRCRPKTGKHGENTIDDFRSDTTYDTLYLRDALWAQRHIKMRQNAGGFDNVDTYDYNYKQPQDMMRTPL